jgi:hypothetical protein
MSSLFVLLSALVGIEKDALFEGVGETTTKQQNNKTTKQQNNKTTKTLF